MNYSIAKNVTLNCIQTSRFKEMCLSIHFFNQVDEKENAQRSLLSMMLSDRCKVYPTKEEMTKVCDSLYGCTLGSRVLSFGQAHCLEIRSKMISPVYIHDNEYALDQWLKFVSDVIFQPLLFENDETIKLFEENKKILLAKIRRKEDDSQTYTTTSALASCEKTLSVRVRGSIKDVENCTLEDILSQYYKMMNENQIEIIVCGEFNEKEIVEKISKTFNFNDRNISLQTHYTVRNTGSNIQKESKDQPQCNIAQVYASHVDVTSPLYPALKVANGILGQLPSSYLFQVIREKHSLCYSIYSSLISYDGAFLITTGIEKENIDKTLSLIEEQIERCKKGDFSDELLETTKKMFVSALRSSQDDMNSMMSHLLNNRLLDRNHTLQKTIDDILEVTREDCIEVFNKFEHLSTYITSKGSDADE